MQTARTAAVWTRSSAGSSRWTNSALWSRKRLAGPSAAKPAGGRFHTPPKDHGRGLRCYMRDPDGHLIEVGQTTGPLRDR
jgi:catechol 2,3-dioxygenase-like lactoylglutathione lyase family enzyme